MSKIFAHITCTRRKWECEDESCDHYGCMDYPTEEHGWIDRHWSRNSLHENRDDVAPAVDLDEGSEYLEEEVKDALGWLEGGYEDNGNGTFCAKEPYRPHDEPWHYSYAIHFTRESYEGRDINGQNPTHPGKGWVEKPWIPPGHMLP